MKKKWRALLIITLAVLLIAGLLVLRSDEWVYRDLLARLRQVEHGARIKRVQLDVLSNRPGCFIRFTLADGLSPGQIEQVAFELRESSDRMIYYITRSTEPGRLSPGDITLLIGGTGESGEKFHLSCNRRIEIEAGVPVAFSWSVYDAATKAMRTETTPYTHPLPVDWMEPRIHLLTGPRREPLRFETVAGLTEYQAGTKGPSARCAVPLTLPEGARFDRAKVDTKAYVALEYVFDFDPSLPEEARTAQYIVYFYNDPENALRQGFIKFGYTLLAGDSREIYGYTERSPETGEVLFHSYAFIQDARLVLVNLPARDSLAAMAEFTAVMLVPYDEVEAP